MRAGIGAGGPQFGHQFIERAARPRADGGQPQCLPAAARVAQQFQAGGSAHAAGRAGDQRADLSSFFHRNLPGVMLYCEVGSLHRRRGPP